MSCIVALVDKGRVWMGADSAGATSGGDRFILRTSKIYKEGEFLIGEAGSARGIQLIASQLDLVAPSADSEGEFTDLDIIYGIVEAMRLCFEEYGYTRTKEGRQESGIFLIGFRGHLYEIQPEFDVLQFEDNYHAIGTGDLPALGALHVTQGRGWTPEKRLKVALEVAAKYKVGVAPPWRFDSVG